MRTTLTFVLLLLRDVSWTAAKRKYNYKMAPVVNRADYVRASRFRQIRTIDYVCDIEWSYLTLDCHCSDGHCKRMVYRSNPRLECVSQRGYGDIRARKDSIHCRFTIYETSLQPFDLLYTFGDIMGLPKTPDYKIVPFESLLGNRWKDNDVGLEYRYYIASTTFFVPGTYYALFALRNRSSYTTDIALGLKYLNVRSYVVTNARTPCEPRLRVKGLGRCGLPEVLEDGRLRLELKVSPRSTKRATRF
ncbi:uncharacterized protein LOC135391011 [Ornithodoros turicata]|uniref:uncharacterized protein LOC135391011 n=1 Tax=Ornithodoros turicata TaxID=34597 RepID=UPI003139BA9A